MSTDHELTLIKGIVEGLGHKVDKIDGRLDDMAETLFEIRTNAIKAASECDRCRADREHAEEQVSIRIAEIEDWRHRIERGDVEITRARYGVLGQLIQGLAYITAAALGIFLGRKI